MTTDEQALQAIEHIRKLMEEAAELKMRSPKNLAKSSWREPTQLVEHQAPTIGQRDTFLQTRLRGEIEEFIKDPSYFEAGDVMNFMAMIIDNAMLAAYKASREGPTRG
jgi:hypothetical protein